MKKNIEKHHSIVIRAEYFPIFYLEAIEIISAWLIIFVEWFVIHNFIAERMRIARHLKGSSLIWHSILHNNYVYSPQCFMNWKKTNTIRVN